MLDQEAEPRGLHAGRVVDDADARVARRERREDVSRAIRRPAVAHEDLDAIRRIVLRLHARDARLDVALLVVRGHRDRDARKHGPRVYRVARATWTPAPTTST